MEDPSPPSATLRSVMRAVLFLAVILAVACGQPNSRAKPGAPQPSQLAEVTTAQRARFAAFGEDLQARGIVTQARAADLRGAIGRDEIHHLLDIVPYCQRGRVIRLSDYRHHKDDSSALIGQILADIATIIPEVKPTSFGGCSESDGCGGAPDRSFRWVASFDNGGMGYSDYMDALDESPLLFNKALADLKSPLRLQVVYREAPVLADDRYADGDFAAFGVIALTEEQATGLYYAGKESRHITTGGYPDYITQAHVRQGIAEYESLGLFAHLTEREIATAREAALAEGVTNFNEVLALFPHVLFHVNFEALEKQHKPYLGVIEGLASITSGDFAPTHVADSSALPGQQEETPFTVSFKARGKRFKAGLGGEYPATEYSELSDTLLDLLNRALASTPAKGQFYELYGTRQFDLAGYHSTFIYLSSRQHGRLNDTDRASFVAVEDEEFDGSYEEVVAYAEGVESSWQRFYTDTVIEDEDEAEGPNVGEAAAVRDRHTLHSLQEALATPLLVHELVLTDQGLDRVPPEIGTLSNLKSLYLNDNKLTSLPPEIGQLRELTYLRLDDNELTSLPPELGQLTNLTKIVASGNRLETLPPELGELPALAELFLEDNRLRSLPREIGSLKAMSWLDVSNNQLTKLPDEIGELSSLTWMPLRNNRLKTLPDTFWKLLRLRRPDLEGNGFGPDDEARIEARLTHYAEIQHWTRPLP